MIAFSLVTEVSLLEIYSINVGKHCQISRSTGAIIYC
jgi:hypothetical protein